MTEKPRTPFVRATKPEGWVMGGLMFVTAILVGVFGGEDRGWIAGYAAGAISALIMVSWPVRKEYWFWLTVGILAALHVFVVWYADWSFTHSWSGRALGGLMMLDISAMMAIVYGLYCLLYGVPVEAVTEVPEEPRYGQTDIDL